MAFPNRRGVCLGLALLESGVTAARAQDAGAALEGTWGGAQGDLTAQVIVTGGQVIGFFWRNDYLDAADAKLSADGRSLSFAFAGGQATLTLTGDAAATLEVSEKAGVVRLDLKRD